MIIALFVELIVEKALPQILTCVLGDIRTCVLKSSVLCFLGDGTVETHHHDRQRHRRMHLHLDRAWTRRALGRRNGNPPWLDKPCIRKECDADCQRGSRDTRRGKSQVSEAWYSLIRHPCIPVKAYRNFSFTPYSVCLSVAKIACIR